QAHTPPQASPSGAPTFFDASRMLDPTGTSTSRFCSRKTTFAISSPTLRSPSLRSSVPRLLFRALPYRALLFRAPPLRGRPFRASSLVSLLTPYSKTRRSGTCTLVFRAAMRRHVRVHPGGPGHLVGDVADALAGHRPPAG